jgi:high affinity sulfate transporter 1
MLDGRREAYGDVWPVGPLSRLPAWRLDELFRVSVGAGRTMGSNLLPIAGWLPRYDRSWLRADVLAGITVWALVVPQAIAYAQIAGLPPHAGVFAAFAAPLGYALFGTSRQLVVSPTSATAAISAALVAPLAIGGNADDFAEHSAALAVLCGVAFLVLGRFRMGFLSQFIAPAVQTGFLVGLGLTIIVGQVFNLLGTSSEDGPFYRQAWHLVTHLDETSGWTLAIGGASLAALMALRRLAPGLPAALIMVVASILVVTVLDLADKGVAVVGEVERAFPLPAIPVIPLDDWLALVPGTLAIVVIGYSESMSVARQFADEHRYALRPNQELVALGMSSAFGGIFQGFITGGGASQSAANDRAGAKSQVSSLVLSALAFLSAVALMPLFRNLPQAVLAAIVISAVMGFIDIPAMQRIRALRTDSFVLACLAMFGVLILGILPGLLMTVAISLAVLLGRLSRPDVTAVGGKAAEFIPDRMLVVRPEAPLLSINAGWIRDAISSEITSSDPEPEVIVLDLVESSELDIGGIDLIRSLRKDARDVGRTLWLANVHPPARAVIGRSQLSDMLTGGLVFDSIEDARAARRRGMAAS